MEPGSLLLNEWLMIIFFAVGVVVWGYVLRGTAGADLATAFLADRKVPGFIASFSTVATNMNANDFIGMAGAVYGFGIILIHQPLLNCVAVLFLGLVLMKKLRRRNVFTLGEWLRERYSNTVGNAYSLIWAFIWMNFNLGLYIYSGALVMNTLVGWNLFVSIVVLTAVAATYTLLGGYRAVVATDVVQLFLMFFPFLFIAGLVWNEVGGPVKLLQSLPAEKTAIWGSTTPFGSLGVTIFGMLLIAMSYWSSEAQVVQRPLSARDPDAAAISYIGAGFWYAILVPFVVFLPALAAIKFFPNLPNNDFATPMLLKKFVPPGLYGVTIVGLLAGIFSSCDSQINSFCTMFTTDIYKRMIRKDADAARLLKVSRLAGVIFTVAAIGTAVIFTFARHGMFLFAVGIVATIMPPFGAVTILGAMWKRASPRGAAVGVFAGMVLAVILFFLDLDGRLAHIAKDTLYFRSMVVFLITLLVAMGVSLLERYESKTPQHDENMAAAKGLNNPKILGALLAGFVAVMYLILTIIG
ncbi:MAG: sodium:solute symporter family transporter [bacterium]